MTYHSIFRPDLFAGQTYIVTGGGTGIGRAVAHELASLGAHVVLAARTEANLARVAAEIAATGGSASYVVANIREEEQVAALFDHVLAERGQLHGLVNNAGGQFRKALKEISTKGFEAVVRTNLTGGFIFMREVYTRWMEKHGGNIVNIAADVVNGWPNYAHSGAARAGMINLTESAASEWAPSGVRINAVAIGGVESSGFDTYTPEAQVEILKFPPTIPMQRYGTVSEVSAAIVFLLSPGASFITGTCLRVDGGAPNARGCWIQLKPHRNAKPFNGFHLHKPPKLLTEGIKPATDR